MKFAPRRLTLALAVAAAACGSPTDSVSNGYAGPDRPARVIYTPGTVTVQPTSTANTFTEGWVGYGDRGTAVGTSAITANPATQVLGTGSLRLTNSAFGWEAAAYSKPAVAAATPLADISELSYSTFTPSGQTGIAVQHITIAFTIDYDLTDNYEGFQGRLTYEPYHCNNEQLDVWQTWNTLDNTTTGCWWQSANPASATRAPYVGDVQQTSALPCPQENPCTWAEVKTAYPNAGFHRTNGATGLIFKVGSAWAGTFYTDKLIVGVNGTSATYDFEPATACNTMCYVNSTIGDDAFGGDTPSTAKKTIGAAITAVSAGGTVIVSAGTYNEAVIVSKNLTLKSTDGASSTIINAPTDKDGIRIEGSTTGVTVGGTSAGFTVNGVDGALPGLERASIYISGTHSNLALLGNTLVAAGEAALVSEYGASLNEITIDRNTFSGKTFTGVDPATGNQFEVPNVARQAVVIGCGAGCANTQNVTFTNNRISAITGSSVRGNQLVTIDAKDVVVRGNSFGGETGPSNYALRMRGTSTHTVEKNAFAATRSAVGLFLTAGAVNGGVTLKDNSFAVSTIKIAVDGTPTATLDATRNWFGSTSGPTYSPTLTNPPTDIIGKVDYSPWILSYTADPAKSGEPGFWPTNIVTGVATTVTAGSNVEAAVSTDLVGTISLSIATAGAGTVTVTETTNPVAENPTATPFQVSGSLVVFDISAPAGSTGPFKICVPGTSPTVLWHYNGTSWDNATAALPADQRYRTVNNVSEVCGQTQTLSPFALAPAKTATSTSLNLSTSAITTTGSAIATGTVNTAVSGTMRFIAGSTTLGSCPLTNATSCSATLSGLTAGTFNIRAEYSGNDEFATSQSGTKTLVVAAAGSELSVNGFSSPVSMTANNAVKAGQAIPLKFRIVNNQGAGTAVSDLEAVLSSATCSGGPASASSPIDASQYRLQNLGGGEYLLHWNTAKGMNGCVAVTMTVSSQTRPFSTNSITARFDFR